MMNKLQPFLSAIVLDERYLLARRFLAELTRRLSFKKHVVSVFLQIDDPYSYLLGHYLPYLFKRYNSVEFQFYICQALRGQHMPEPTMLAEYAIEDCRLLAREIGIPFLDKGDAPVVEYRRTLLEFLAAEQEEKDFGEAIISALSYYWRGDVEGIARMLGRTHGESAETNVLVGRNQLLLRKMGHYSCATMHYAGEWYWGVDRLHYLIDRLDRLRLNRFPEDVPEFVSLAQATHLKLPATNPGRAKTLPVLEYFHSFRSPFSYIGLQEAFDVADAFGMQLEIRPVLPMLMRGMAVPTDKIDYSLMDAKREAVRKGDPFSRITDPLGLGVERCMAVFVHAKEQSKERDFVLAAGKAIFADGVDVANDEGMQIVAKNAGLKWPEVQNALRNDHWRDLEGLDRGRLFDAGHWGVPVYKIGEQSFWGQDRAWLMARKLEDLCHDGEGIMI